MLELMDANHVALSALTGSSVMGVFHTLSAGNAGQSVPGRTGLPPVAAAGGSTEVAPAGPVAPTGGLTSPSPSPSPRARARVTVPPPTLGTRGFRIASPFSSELHVAGTQGGSTRHDRSRCSEIASAFRSLALAQAP